MKVHRQFLAVATLALISLTNSSQAAIDLNFGLYTSNKPTSMVRKFRPILDAIEDRISERLGESVQIRMQVAKDYNKGIEHLASGKVDFKVWPRFLCRSETRKLWVENTRYGARTKTEGVLWNHMCQTG